MVSIILHKLNLVKIRKSRMFREKIHFSRIFKPIKFFKYIIVYKRKAKLKKLIHTVLLTRREMFKTAFLSFGICIFGFKKALLNKSEEKILKNFILYVCFTLSKLVKH